jgi:cyanobactin maturation PatA/PatG family protease
VTPSSECHCEACQAKANAGPFGPGSLVFALGHLDIDLVTETRQYSLQQHLWEFRHKKKGVDFDATRLPTTTEANPLDLGQMLDYLEDDDNCWDAAAVTWVLKLYQTPIYAIQPAGPFAQKIHKVLIKTTREQQAQKLDDRVEWMSVPGRLSGHVRLYNGHVVPAIVPEPRGMYSWNLIRLMQEVAGAPSSPKAVQVRECLDRVYHELRNLGLTSRDRALNYAATNAAQVGSIFTSVLAGKEAVALDSIDAEPSPYCPPGSDCWDVLMYFFYPDRPTPSTRKAYRFTVDVSDVVPVMVGPLRSWNAR